MPWCPVCGNEMVNQKSPAAIDSTSTNDTVMHEKNRPVSGPVDNKVTFNSSHAAAPAGYTLVFASQRPVGTTVTALLDSEKIDYLLEADSRLGSAGKMLYPKVFVKSHDVKTCLELFEKHGLC